jgi:hypothetical protein
MTDLTYLTAVTTNRSEVMSHLHLELSRAQLEQRHVEAARKRRVLALAAHRRWRRRAEHAAYRARLALAAR